MKEEKKLNDFQFAAAAAGFLFGFIIASAIVLKIVIWILT